MQETPLPRVLLADDELEAPDGWPGFLSKLNGLFRTVVLFRHKEIWRASQYFGDFGQGCSSTTLPRGRCPGPQPARPDGIGRAPCPLEIYSQ
jgi:hypothetical protein